MSARLFAPSVFKTGDLAYDDDLSETSLNTGFSDIGILWDIAATDNSGFGSPWLGRGGENDMASGPSVSNDPATDTSSPNAGGVSNATAATTPQASTATSDVAATNAPTTSASLSAATTGAASAPSASLAAPAGFTASDLIFNDSFSGASLNAANWNTYIASAASNGYPWYSTSSGGSGVGGVYEDEFDMPSQVSVSNGLTLDAVRQSITATNNLGSGTVTQTFPVTSGVVCTYGKLDFDGGYLQISMKEPGGDGSWPGLWLLPGAGAKSGDNFEIDIQEGGYTLGSANPNDVFAWHLHGPSGTVGGEVNTGIDLTAGFNTYAINWVPGVSITWYLNGAQVGQVTSAQATIPNEPMELIMSNQVADSAASGWHTVLDSSTPQSMPMQIAGVQLYQGGGATASAATVTQVTAAPGSGVELPGATIVFTMTMSAAVTVSGAPTLSLNDGGVAAYTGGSGTATLTFSYTVSSSDSTVAGLAITAVNLPGGATISAGGLAANLANAPTTFAGLSIDPPTVSQVTASPGGGVELPGATVVFTMKMSEAVTVAGAPTLSLNDGGVAAYTGGSGTAALTFSYTVSASDSTLAGLAVTGVNLPSGAAISAGGLAANLANAPTTFAGLSIDPPTVVQVTASPASGVELPGATVVFTMKMSEAVTVSGAPTLSLNDGGLAAYSGGSGSNTLTFSYVVSSSDSAVAALGITGVNLPNGAAISAGGLAAILTNAPTTFANLSIDPPSNAPTVTQVTVLPAAGVELPGATITFTMNMNEAVTVAGAPTLSLNDGGVAAYTGGSGSATLTFSYTVSSSDSEVASLAITAVNLPNGAAISAGGLAANLANALTTFPGLSIDPPSVASIAFSPASADVGVGGAVTVTLTWNEAVTVTGGAPTLTLNDGGAATYTGGSGSSTLTFSYIAAAGQNTASLAATGLALNGSTLANGLGATADLSLAGLAQVGPQIGAGPAPTITNAGGYVSSQTQTLSGTVNAADAGVQVEVFDGTTHVGTAIPNPVTGAWSVAVSLAPGANALTAQAVDAAGNVGTSAAVGLDWVTATVAGYQQTGSVNVVDTAANVTANITTLKAQSNIASITIADTAANLQGLTTTKIQSLSGSKPTLLDAVDQDPTFTSTQKRALGKAGIQVEQPYIGGGVELLAYTAAGLLRSVEYVGVTGAPFTSYTVQYGSSGQPTSASYSNGMTQTWTYGSRGSYSIKCVGITGEPYTSDTINYGSNGKPSSATYSNGMAESWTYNSKGSYSIAYVGVTGAQYTSYTTKYGSNGKPTSASYGNGMTESFTYNSNGSYAIAYVGVTGEPYASYTTNYAANGNPTSATFSNGMAETWTYNPDGSYEMRVTGVTGSTLSSYEALSDAIGANAAMAQDMVSGSGVLTLSENNLTVTSSSGGLGVTVGVDAFGVNQHADETINATSGDSESFEFGAGFGAATIAGLVATGTSPDLIQLNVSSFSYMNPTMTQAQDLAAVLGRAQQVGANVAITDSALDTLTLNNVTLATLAANPGVFKFV